MAPQEHWEGVYSTRAPTDVSWFQAHAELSLAMIERTGLPHQASVIDVGGGASTLTDDLLRAGWVTVTVLDVSGSALGAARARLGDRADQVRWIEADVLTADLPEGGIDLWHDRAVFHFLTDPADRSSYCTVLRRALQPDGHVILATFAEDGPRRCSGLPVKRYSASGLAEELGSGFTLVEHDREEHRTPTGAVQPFTYARFRASGRPGTPDLPS